MTPLAIFESAINALKKECFELADQAGLFLEVDAAGNIWLGEDNEECYRVHGWHTTHHKITQIIERKEVVDNGKS